MLIDSLNTAKECRLKQGEFQKLTELIYNECGIHLPHSKQLLVEGRIQKRLKYLDYESHSEYLEYLFSREGYSTELVHLIDVITTNKTDFFREPAHFEYLEKHVIPEILNEQRSTRIMGWSAGCSTGEEPYTLAIVLKECLMNSGLSYLIYASDISSEVIRKAKNAVYDYNSIEIIPLSLKKKYLLKSKNKEQKIVKIIPELRNLVEFHRINFIENEYQDIPDNLDFVFCRNVIIYFDKETQEKVLSKISKKIRKGGYLFIGHSETLMNMDLPLKRVASTIYLKV